MTDNENQIFDLVEKAKAGNKASLNQLVDLFHKDIFRMVYYRTCSQMDAEDLTQDIFMQMVKRLPSVKDPGLFKSWLFKIAINRVRDFYRKKRIPAFFVAAAETDDKRLRNIEPNNTPANHLMQKEFWKQFYRFTGRLSRMEREVFILRFVDHLGIREITEALKKNESTVKTHLYRALKKFRQAPEFQELLKGETL